MPNARISIAVPALNEARNIARLLISLRENLPAGADVEIVVGDHGSTDQTVAIASANGASVISLSGGTVASVRNRIVDHCVGEVLIFLDADTSVTRSWGENLLGTLEEVRANPKEITGSICSTGGGDSLLHRCWFSRMGNRQMAYLGTAHMIIRKQFFSQLNGFDANLSSGEDFDLCMRAIKAGGSIRSRPILHVVHHEYPTGLTEFLKREGWHGSGDFQSFETFRRSKVAIATTLFAALNVLTLLFSAAGSYMFVAPCCALITLLVMSSFSRFKKLDLSCRLWNIGIYYFYFLGRSGALLALIWKKAERSPRH